MKSLKYEAVRIKGSEGTGWEVRTKFRKLWYTVCDVWSGPDGTPAEHRANQIADLLNKEQERKVKA